MSAWCVRAAGASGRATPLACRLGRHRMRYVGVILGRRLEACERCSRRRLVVL